MSVMGLGSLISGMKEGYEFADRMKERKADAKYKEDARAQQKKGWDKENSYDDEIKSLTEQFTGAATPPAVPAVPVGSAPPAAMGTQVAAPAMAGESAQAQAAMPNSPAAAGTAAPAAAAQPNPFGNTNNTFDFAIKRAMIDVKHGKMTGEGLLNMTKLVDTMQAEKMTQSIALMHQGRTDEALSAFNSTGKHRAKLLSQQDGVFESGGVKVPTKLVTIEEADGSTRTINTAQALFQMQSMDKIISQAQQGEQLGIAGKQQVESARHNKASEIVQTEHNRAMERNAAGQLALAGKRDARESQQFRKLSIEGQLEEIEKVVGPLSAADKTAYGKKLLGLTAKDSKGVDDDLIKDLTKEWSKNNPGSAPAEVAKFRDGLNKAFTTIKNNAQVEDVLRSELGKHAPGSVDYAKTWGEAKSQLGMTDAQLVKMGYQVPPAAARPVAAPAALGTRIQPASDTTKAWVRDKLIGPFDGPGKYAEIARNHPNPEVRRAAAELAAEFAAQQQQAAETFPEK
jgi:hypothetical protein